MTICNTNPNYCDATKCNLLTGQCTNIKLYKNGQVVTQSQLQPGDSIVIAVAGSNATKARIRINGGTYTETTTKNAQGEYTMDYTFPNVDSGTFAFEAEVFIAGSWK
jgi:phage-related protein